MHDQSCNFIPDFAGPHCTILWWYCGPTVSTTLLLLLLTLPPGLFGKGLVCQTATWLCWVSTLLREQEIFLVAPSRRGGVLIISSPAISGKVSCDPISDGSGMQLCFDVEETAAEILASLGPEKSADIYNKARKDFPMFQSSGVENDITSKPFEDDCIHFLHYLREE